MAQINEKKAKFCFIRSFARNNYSIDQYVYVELKVASRSILI